LEQIGSAATGLGRLEFLAPGPNPTTSIYNATGSLARFENKNIRIYFEKRYSLLQRWRCSCKFKSRRIGSRVTRFVCEKIAQNLPQYIFVEIYALP
jgi:hypothetical protein